LAMGDGRWRDWGDVWVGKGCGGRLCGTMKIGRYRDSVGAVRWCGIGGDGAVRVLDGEPFSASATFGAVADVAELLVPVDPPAIYCIGLNYSDHAAESGAKVPEFPMVFMKSPSALNRDGGVIELPRHLASTQVDYEAELVVVVGKTCKNVKKGEGLKYVGGYACGNDISARDWQKLWGGGQFCRAKTFDTFAPIGPWVVTADEVKDVQKLGLRTRLNGTVVQQGTTAEMIFPVAELIEFLSGSTTLEAGTVIFTGTPAGVGMGKNPPLYLKAGDRVEVEVDGLGVLTNTVKEERV
jgi:2-keto-4-pentenoate hydratase/2-oxohepta-3-ene-1,7-dioic acid hydratase in catechol pathway